MLRAKAVNGDRHVEGYTKRQVACGLKKSACSLWLVACRNNKTSFQCAISREEFAALPHIPALAAPELWLPFRHGPRISAAGPPRPGNREKRRVACSSWPVVGALMVTLPSELPTAWTQYFGGCAASSGGTKKAASGEWLEEVGL